MASGTFTANGSSDVIALDAALEEVSYSVTGPHHGRVRLQRQYGSIWKTLDSITAGVTGFTTGRSARLRLFADLMTMAVTNGDFAAATGWTLTAPWSIGSGVATRTASASNPNLDQVLPDTLVSGASYVVTFDITTTAGSLTVSLGGGTASSAISDAEDTVSVTLVAGSSNNVLRFVAGATYAGTLDNVVITPSVAWSLSEGDALIPGEIADNDGAIARFRQSGLEVVRDLSVAGNVSVTGSVVTGSITAPANGVGAVAGTGNTAVETGNGLVQRTTITLADHEITVTDANAYAGSKLYDFPEGNILVLGATADLSFAVTSARAGTINDDAALDWSLGSVTAEDTTLDTTEANFIAKQDLTLDEDDDGEHPDTAVMTVDVLRLAGTGTAADLFLNLSFPTTTNIDGDGTIEVEGTIVLTWLNLGDF